MTTSLVILRRIAFVTVVATVAIAALGVSKLRINSHYTAYFDDDDPLLIADRELSDLYSRQDGLFVVLQSANSFLGSENYRLLEDLTALLAAQPVTTSALSITELGIIGENSSNDGDFMPSLRQLKNESQSVGLLLAESTMLAGIWLQIKLPDSNSRSVLETISAIRRLVDSTINDLPVSAHYTGTLALNEAYIEVVRDDLARIVPTLLLLMIIILGSLLRSLRTVLMMLPVGICSVLAALGIVGLFGAELAAINAFVPIIVISISLAGCVHIARLYTLYRDSGMPAEEAAVSSSRDNLLPMSLANGTTALGFLGLTLSPSPPIQLFGHLAAVGIVVSFILCLTLLPVLLACFDPWKPAAESRNAFLPRLALFVTEQRVRVVIVFAILSLPAAWFASQNVVSDNIVKYFAPSHSFYQDTKLVEDQLSGVNEVLYSIDTGKRHGLFDASAIEALGRLSTWLGQQAEVNHVVSIANDDVFEEARRAGRLQQRLDFYRDRIDESGGTNPLLALEVSADYSSSVVTAYLRRQDSALLIEFDKKVHAWARKNLGGFSIRSGGPALMFANLGEKNIRGMLTALVIALLAAALILGAVFRSGRIVWIALVCNTLPILLVYSIWALAIGQISLGAAVVIGMILGIVLDDSIYLLATYQRGLQLGKCKPVAYALCRVGPALVVTTITLVAGLSLGLFSDFSPIWSMSVLSATIIGTALIVDLLLLPALLPADLPREGET